MKDQISKLKRKKLDLSNDDKEFFTEKRMFHDRKPSYDENSLDLSKYKFNK